MPAEDRGPTKFELRRAATRAELIRLGLERFPQRGYAATTIEDLLRDAPFTRGAFYFHFPTKEDLFLTLLEQRAEHRSPWWLAGRGAATLRAALPIMLMKSTESDGADGGDWLALTSEFAASVRNAPEHLPRLQALHERWLDEVEGGVLDLREMGFVRDDLPTRTLAQTVLATVDGHRLHALSYGLDLRLLIESVARILEPPAR